MRMKKIFYLFIMAIFAVSCEGPMGPPGPQGPQGPQAAEREPDAYWDEKDFIIDQWDLDESGDYFYASFSVDDLDVTIYDFAIIVAYIETITPNASYKTPLPYTRQCKAPTGTPGVEHTWSEVIDFTFALGDMTFYLSPSDFDTSRQPAPIKIRAIFVW